MNLTGFVKYLIESKGFVVIDGKVYRNGYRNREFKETFPYHGADIRHKWGRHMKNTPLTDDDLFRIIEELDISKRTVSEQKRLERERELVEK